MDEAFDCWTKGKNSHDYHRHFSEWWERDLREMVRRDRNHPSIVLYSVGNEIRDTHDADHAKKILADLVRVCHEEDPTRPVTQALFRPNVTKDYDNGLADLLDVIGTNYRDTELLDAWKDDPEPEDHRHRAGPRAQHLVPLPRPCAARRAVPVVRHRLPRRVPHLAGDDLQRGPPRPHRLGPAAWLGAGELVERRAGGEGVPTRRRDRSDPAGSRLRGGRVEATSGALPRLESREGGRAACRGLHQRRRGRAFPQRSLARHQAGEEGHRGGLEGAF